MRVDIETEYSPGDIVWSVIYMGGFAAPKQGTVRRVTVMCGEVVTEISYDVEFGSHLAPHPPALMARSLDEAVKRFHAYNASKDYPPVKVWVLYEGV
jgi:hypothetical protein